MASRRVKHLPVAIGAGPHHPGRGLSRHERPTLAGAGRGTIPAGLAACAWRSACQDRVGRSPARPRETQPSPGDSSSRCWPQPSRMPTRWLDWPGCCTIQGMKRVRRRGSYRAAGRRLFAASRGSAGRVCSVHWWEPQGYADEAYPCAFKRSDWRCFLAAQVVDSQPRMSGM
jgi:hypothetical protein